MKLQPNSIIIFTLSAYDVRWALEFKSQQRRQVFIYAPTAQSQMELIKRRQPFLDYYSILPKKSYLIPSDYLSQFNKSSLYSDCQRIMNRLKHSIMTRKAILSKNSRWSILQYPLFYECADTVYARALYENLLKKKPYAVYFPTYLTLKPVKWKGKMYSTCAILADFLKKSGKSAYYPSSREDKDSISLPRFTLFKEFILFAFYKLKYLLSGTQQSSPDVLFHIGGEMLRYYLQVFHILQRKQLKIAIVGYRQTVEDKIFALKYNLPLISPSLGKSTQSNKEFNTISKHFGLMSKTSPLLNSFINRKLALYWRSNGKKLLNEREVANRLFKTYKTSVFISTHDPGPVAATYITQAHKKSVRTLTLLHGMPVNPFEVDFLGQLVAAWGKITKQYILNHTNKSEKLIKALGFPGAHSLISNVNKKTKARKPKDGVITIGLLLTIYLPFDESALKFLHELFAELAHVRNKVSIRLRTHSGQDTAGFKDIAHAYHLPLVLNPKETLLEFVEKTDVIICWDTTAVILPLLLHKPLFHTSPLWGSGIYPLSRYRAAWIPKDATDLVRQLQDYIRKPSLSNTLIKGQLNYLQNVVGDLDIESSTKLANYIENQIKASNTFN